MVDHVPDCGIDRERKMVVIERGASGIPTLWCDPCIAPMIAALNKAGIRTIASCCGHGHMPPTIALASGEWLVVARDDAERRRIDALFPVDINGEPTPERGGEDG